MAIIFGFLDFRKSAKSPLSPLLLNTPYFVSCKKIPQKFNLFFLGTGVGNAMLFTVNIPKVALLYFHTTLKSEVRFWDLGFCGVLVAQGIHAMGFKNA